MRKKQINKMCDIRIFIIVKCISEQTHSQIEASPGQAGSCSTGPISSRRPPRTCAAVWGARRAPRHSWPHPAKAPLTPSLLLSTYASVGSRGERERERDPQTKYLQSILKKEHCWELKYGNKWLKAPVERSLI